MLAQVYRADYQNCTSEKRPSRVVVTQRRCSACRIVANLTVANLAFRAAWYAVRVVLSIGSRPSGSRPSETKSLKRYLRRGDTQSREGAHDAGIHNHLGPICAQLQCVRLSCIDGCDPLNVCCIISSCIPPHPPPPPHHPSRLYTGNIGRALLSR